MICVFSFQQGIRLSLIQIWQDKENDMVCTLPSTENEHLCTCAGFIRSGKVRGERVFCFGQGKSGNVREACSGQGQNSVFILRVREIFHFSPSKKYAQHFNN